MQAGLTAVSQATHSAKRRLPASLPNAMAIPPPTIKILGTLVPSNSRDARLAEMRMVDSKILGNVATRLAFYKDPAGLE